MAVGGAWLRVDLGMDQCPGRRFGGDKYGQFGTEAAVGTQVEGGRCGWTLFCSCIGLLLQPKTCSIGVGTGQALEENQAKPKGYREMPTLEALPGSTYQPRFLQSKVMTPFSSGVHLMPGERKAGCFTGSGRLFPSPWLGADTQDGQDRASRSHPINEEAGQGEAARGGHSTLRLPHPVGVQFTGRTPIWFRVLICEGEPPTTE